MLKKSKKAKRASHGLGKMFSWVPLSPDSMTILSIILAFFAFLLAICGSFAFSVTSLILFVFAFFLDAIDGAVARAKNMATKSGAFLDGISDRMVEFFLIFSLYFIFFGKLEFEIPIIAILFFGTCMTSFVKAYAEHTGVLKNEDALKLPGLLERAERSLLLLVAFTLSVFSETHLAFYILCITSALTFITFVQRFWLVYSRG